MDQLERGVEYTHKPTGLTGKVNKLYNNGAWGLFASPTGALFTVHASEMRVMGEPTDPAQDMLDWVMCPVKQCPSGNMRELAIAGADNITYL